LPALSIPAYQADAEFFSFSRRCKVSLSRRCNGFHKYLKLTFSFNRLAESIPPAKLPAHRSVVEEVYRASLIQIRLPVGYARLRKRSDFGALPLATRKGSTVREISPPALAPVIVANVPAAVEANTAALTQPVPAIAKPADRGEKKVFIDPVEAATTQRARSRSGRKRRSRNPLEHHLQRTNRKCVSALLILLGAISALVVGVIVTKHTRLAVLGGLLFLTVIPAWIWSMVLAVLGLRQCLRHAERYSRGKTFAILTLAFGSFIGLLLVPGLIGGIKGAMAANQARSRFSREGQGAFEELNFNFNAPRGWKLWEKRTTMQGVVLAFGNENSPMILNLTAQALPPGLLDPRRHVMELSREAYQREATSYRLISEGEVIRNGLAGWQAETQGIVQGRDCYHVRWIVATNGFGYQIMVFGPSANANQIKEGAEAAFQNFELLQRSK
jgi:hypothetical protein